MTYLHSKNDQKLFPSEFLGFVEAARKDQGIVIRAVDRPASHLRRFPAPKDSIMFNPGESSALAQARRSPSRTDHASNHGIANSQTQEHEPLAAKGSISVSTLPPAEDALRLTSTLQGKYSTLRSAKKSKNQLKNHRLTQPSHRKKSRSYAPPSTYAHLDRLPDLLECKLDVVFCGINPGCRSASVSHYYAHPTNQFWKCLHLSGFTPACLSPKDDRQLPSHFRLGLTDLVSRPTAEANELSYFERLQAVPSLFRKLDKFRPKILCFVGVRQYLDLCSYLKKSSCYSGFIDLKKLTGQLGLQNIILKYSSEQAGKSTQLDQISMAGNIATRRIETNTNGFEYTFVFIAPSTSALARKYSLIERVELFETLRKFRDKLAQDQIDQALPSGSCFVHVQNVLSSHKETIADLPRV
ncbi:hypothetical protein O181_026414 [Austropuccinia psidii MF-1]|uniref:Uracil-DNA glycosylase-like domain-containing protein n=1 Tax=Austropuccinia psidii MF-1 TaxID=1389203 RepID=A0A9Q3H1K9_9BASI|nr:hypothetical protein [Austropuccinia psidii MF-1]